MDKKAVYEHLAKIYLDGSRDKIKQEKKYFALRNLYLLGIPAAAVLWILLTFLFFKQMQPHLNSQTALLLNTDPIKINFNFDPAKKEIYSISLNNTNLAKYHSIGFSLKKANLRSPVSLRVEFSNAFNEKSEVYIRNITDKWNSYQLSFLDFKGITDWSNIHQLDFIVEQWNTKDKNGIIYIDNLRFLR